MMASSHTQTWKVEALIPADAMKDASEDEQPDDFVEPSKTSSKGQKSRSQREEALRKMMDEEGMLPHNRL